MSNPEHDKFGSACGGSRWFKAEPEIKEEQVYPVRQRWACPIEGCDGEMIFNGMTWPTGNPGYHHTCNKCEFTAAIHGARYPQVTYKTMREPAPVEDPCVDKCPMCGEVLYPEDAVGLGGSLVCQACRDKHDFQAEDLNKGEEEPA